MIPHISITDVRRIHVCHVSKIKPAGFATSFTIEHGGGRLELTLHTPEQRWAKGEVIYAGTRDTSARDMSDADIIDRINNEPIPAKLTADLDTA
jgi:hypothetical protein